MTTPRSLRSAVLAVTLATLACLAHAAPIIEPTELATRLDGPPARGGPLRIVDIRDGRDASGQTPYALGHLPGAVHAPYSQWRGPQDNPGRPLDAAALTALIQRLGIERDTDVVIVHAGRDATDFGAAARVYWTLKTAGLSRLSILNGGIGAWRAAGRPLVTHSEPVRPSAYVAQVDTRLIATREQVARAQAAGTVKLVDARPKAFFEGETRHAAARAPGTIAGASHLDSAAWFAAGRGVLLAQAELRRVAAANGLEPGSAADSVAFCNTGHWAATNWFVMSEMLGERNVSLYAESIVDWSRAGLPMANVPGRLRQLLIDLKLASQ
jgi:thiosulfate/3-mercaptopyruvate sulfurtransferase